MSCPRYQVHFLPPNVPISTATGNAPTRRSIELTRSDARSHAARVSHPAAKGHRALTSRIRLPKLSTSENDATTILPESSAGNVGRSLILAGTSGAVEAVVHKRSRNTKIPTLRYRLQLEDGRYKPSLVSAEQEDLESVIRFESVTSILFPFPKQISRSALDPFARSALELSVPDEQLLHVYLSTVPDQIYGSAPSDISEVIRNGTLGLVATNDLAVMWLLLLIESRVTSFQPTIKDRHLSSLTRRSAVYRLMNQRLADQSTAPTDEFILAVAVAAASELRMGNSQSARQHVTAVRKLLELRGGLRSIRHLTYPLGPMVVSHFVEQGIKGLWKSHDGLQNKLSTLSQWIRDAQTWNFTLRHPASSTQQKYCNDLNDVFDRGGNQQLQSNDHQSRRARAFDPRTVLYDYVHLPGGVLDDAQFRFYLSVLYALNKALHGFRDSETTTNVYLEGLTTAVRLSAVHNFTLRASGAKLPSLLLLLMLVQSAFESCEPTISATELVNIEEVFEFIEIMMMASPASRMAVLEAFVSWLITPIPNPGDLIFINDATLDILAGEVECTWRTYSPRETG